MRAASSWPSSRSNAAKRSCMRMSSGRASRRFLYTFNAPRRSPWDRQCCARPSSRMGIVIAISSIPWQRSEFIGVARHDIKFPSPPLLLLLFDSLFTRRHKVTPNMAGAVDNIPAEEHQTNGMFGGVFDSDGETFTDDQQALMIEERAIDFEGARDDIDRPFLREIGHF